ncbi:MAG: FAD-dependent oxidoreductase, partial [Rhizobacter sp.]|nr:FAD-dependent oxidoreductase [Ferruginibacter sp.]
LAKFGKKVLLLEQHYIPGGCATAFKRKDFVMEVGLHEMDGLFEKDSKVKIFDFLEVNKNIQFEQVPELFRFVTRRVDFVFPHGTEHAFKTLSKKYPADKAGINKLFKLMNGALEEIAGFPTSKWKTALLYPILPLLFPNIVKASKNNLGDWMDKHIQNEDLKLILQGNLLYFHDDPYSMSLLYFSMAQASYIGGGGHFIKGGSQKLSDYLAKVINDNNGQVLLGKKVEQIIVKEGKVVGVIFKDAFDLSLSATEIYADVVIANAAVPLVANMLPSPFREILEKKTAHLQPSCSLISIYIGFKKAVKELGNAHYSTFVNGDDVQSLKDIKSNNKGRWENKTFIFVDYSQIDSGLTPEGKSFGVICAADYLAEWENLDVETYRNKKEEVAQIFFKRLEKIIPGIEEQIEYYEVGTAKTIQRYTSNPNGAPYGYAQTPDQSGMKRLPMQSPVKNLYFASAWTFPGGGFTGAIVSGFLCANEVRKSLKSKHEIEQIDEIKDERIVAFLEKRIVAENTIEIVFEKPKGFHFSPGQYVVLSLNNPKTNYLDLPFRSLSILSHPDENVLRFAMRLSASSFSKSCSEMAIGDRVTIYGPMGSFMLNDQNENIVFIAGGIGITPVVSLIKELKKRSHQGEVFLFYSNRNEVSAAYHILFQNISLTNFKYIPVYTETQSRINGNLLKNELQNFLDYNYFVVGTSGFTKSIQQTLITNGAKASSIKKDDFG